MKKNQLAFTLIEILISFSLAIILMAFGLPGLFDFLSKTKDEILQQQLLQAISLAKAQARERRLPVAVCQSDNLKICGGHWENGLLIFLDENKTGIITQQKQIITALPAYAAHGSLHWRSFPVHRNYLLFLPLGLKASNGSFWHCHQLSVKWAIIINKAGRARSVYPDENGVVKDSRNQALSCA